MTTVSVRAEYRLDSPYVATAAPRVSWKTQTAVADWAQRSAELEWTLGGHVTTVTVDGPDSVFVPWPFPPLAPHASGQLRVRVEGPDGWSDFSGPVTVAAGILGDGEWQADWIALRDPSGPQRPLRARCEFAVRDGLSKATLFASAHGVYQVEINGAQVDDEVMKPGWTPYPKRILCDVTDVTTLVRVGRNAVGAQVAAGWYAERFGFRGGDRPVFGEQCAFGGQLLLEYADGTSEWVRSSTGWRVTEAGPVRASGLYAGEDYDARQEQAGWSEPGFDASDWDVPAVVPGRAPEPRFGPVVRVTEKVAVQKVFRSPTGKLLIDFGQNLVGRLRIRVTGEAGTQVTLRHAEVLENGELGTRPLRRAAATDTYTLSGRGDEVWEPSFTFHGFRYAQIDGWPGEFDPDAVTAIVVGSDMERTGWFECSDPLVNQLHENIVWGMRGNFLSIPTDCPQRDERLGWTGDIQVFSPAATYLYEVNGFLTSWLVDLALDQAASGSVPFVVPDVLDSADTPACAWGDAATMIPWTLYERFADRSVVETQYPSMKAWVDCLLRLAGDRMLWENSFQLGDWLDPDAPPDFPAKAKADPDLLASAYLYRSAVLVADAARLLGHDEDARHYTQCAQAVRAAWTAEYLTPAGRLMSDCQTACAIAIRFGLVDGPVAERLAARLASLVRKDGYRIGTGFIGTPLVTDALTDHGHNDQASRLLRQTRCPSWLYPVTMGATTVWERWDSMLPDGSINPGEMTSFNHYAFGAVADWLHRVVGGLAAALPGYRKLAIAPVVLSGLEWVSTRHETPYGLASVQWRRHGAEVTIHVTVPANTTACVRLPDGRPVFDVGSGDHEWTCAIPARPTPAPLDIRRASFAEVIDDEEAFDAIVGAIEAIDPGLAEEFLVGADWIPGRAFLDGFTMLRPQVLTAIDEALAALNAGRQS